MRVLVESARQLGCPCGRDQQRASPVALTESSDQSIVLHDCRVLFFAYSTVLALGIIGPLVTRQERELRGWSSAISPMSRFAALIAQGHVDFLLSAVRFATPLI